MRRISLVAWILVVLGLLVGGIWTYVRCSHRSRTLARARVALQAGQPDKALQLAARHAESYPTDWQGYFVQGLARMRLGEFARARQALQRAVDLQPREVSAVIALAETYVLPATRELRSEDSSGRLAALRAGIEQLRKANAVLAAGPVNDAVAGLPLRGMIGSNTAQMARAHRRIAGKLGDDARTAQAAEAVERAREIREQADAEWERAGPLAEQAVGILCEVLTDAKTHLPGVTEKAPLALLLKLVDAAARDAVQIYVDTQDAEHRRRVAEAVAGLEDISPVAVMRMTMHEIRTGSFPNGLARRTALEQAGRQVEALLGKARQRPGDHRELLLARAQVGLALKDYETAERICKEVLADVPTQPMARLVLAESLLARGEFQQAEKALFVLRADVPRSPEIAFAHARAAAASGKRELAREAMQTAAQLDPKHADARRWLIEEYLAEGYLDQAYTEAKEYHRHCADDPVALRLLVEAAHRTGRSGQAEQVLQEALRRDPARPELLVAAAEAYAELRDTAQSIEIARRAAQMTPATTEGRLAVARALALTGQFARAESILARELDANPDSAAVPFEMARLYAATGRNLEAIEKYRAAVDKEPLSSAYRLALAEALLKEGNLQQSWDALSDLPANHPRAGLLRLQIRLLQGQPISPPEMLHHAHPGSQAGISLGLTFLRNGQPSQCLDTCLAELESSPRDVDLRMLAGQAALMMGRSEEARRHWAAALEAEPGRFDIYLRLAEALARREPVERVARHLAALPAARKELVQLAVGWLWVQSSQGARAAEVFRQVAEQENIPRGMRQRARFLLARGLARSHRIGESLVELDALAREDSCRREALAAKANVLVNARRDKDAGQILAELLTDAKRRADTEQMAEVVRLYQGLGLVAQALAACDEILAVGGGDHRGNLLKAGVLRAAGQLDLAAVCYRKAIEALPANLAAYRGLIDVLDAQGKPLEALEALRPMAGLGPPGRAAGLLTRARLLTGWGLHDQAADCLTALGELGCATDPQIQLALGRSFAELGQMQEARGCLERIALYAPQYVAARLDLARIARSPAEALAVLDKLAKTHPDRDDVLEPMMARRIQDGQTAGALERFRSYVRESCRARKWPEGAAFLAVQVMVESSDHDGACELAGELARQTGRRRWRRLAALLAPAASPAADPIAAAETEAMDALLGIVNASRGQDTKAARAWLARLERIRTDAPKTVPPAYRVLAALAADEPRQAHDALSASPDELVGMPRVLALGLLSDTDPARRRKHAAGLLRASLALDLEVRPLAHRIAMDLLSADRGCQWAAVLAARAGRDPASWQKVLAALGPSDGPVRQAIQGRLWQEQEQYEKAAEAYRLAAAAADNALDLRLEQAVALEKAGRFAEALDLYRQVLSEARGRLAGSAANNAAYLVARVWPEDKVRLAEAYRWAAAAVAAAPDVHTFHDTKGWIAHLLGRTQEACAELRRALRGMSDSHEVHAHLAQAEAAAGNHELAGWHRQAAERLARGPRARARDLAKADPPAPPLPPRDPS